MKLTGPEAVPPPDIFSLEARMGLRLLPAPEPNLKSIASVLARSMIDDIVSWTELMKQAEHCGFSSMPTLNQTGELKAIFWWTSRWVSSALKVWRSSVGREVVLGLGPAAIVLTTRSMSCWTLVSRSGVPRWPRKYLLTTTLVASCDQKFGTSTSFCSKTLLPVSFVMPASGTPR